MKATVLQPFLLLMSPSSYIGVGDILFYFILPLAFNKASNKNTRAEYSKKFIIIIIIISSSSSSSSSSSIVIIIVVTCRCF
jgi:hypothetical protein